MKDIKKEYRFEDALRRLEEIVDKMERGHISIEDAEKLFEEGKGLITHCQEILTRLSLNVINLKGNHKE